MEDDEMRKILQIATKTLILSLIFTLLTPALINLSLCERPSVTFRVEEVFWGESSDNQIDVNPGDTDVPLTIHVRNISNHTLIGIQATLEVNYPFANVTGGSLANATGEPLQVGDIMHPIPNVPPGTAFSLTFRLNIDQDAKAGSYTYPVTIDYLVNQSGIFIVGEPKTLNVTIILPNRAPVITSSIPMDSSITVYVGDSLNFSVECYDPDDDVITYRWILDGSNVGNMSWYVYTPTSQDVGTHTVEVRVSDGNLIVSRSWSVSVDKLKTMSITVSENYLFGGLDNTLNITLQNNFWKDVVQIDVSVPSQAPLIIYGNHSWIFRSVEPGDAISIILDVYAPQSSIGATYSISITASYYDEYGRRQTDTLNVGLIVRGLISITIYDINVTPEVAHPDSEVMITATILNKGNIAAKSMNISIQPSQILTLSYASKYYIDELEPNSPEPIGVRAYMKPNIANGTYPITITISYLDDQLIEQTITIKTLIKVVKATEESNAPSGEESPLSQLLKDWWTLLILAAAAVTLLILYIRRSK